MLATQASCALALMVASFSANALLTLSLRESWGPTPPPIDDACFPPSAH